MEKYRFVEQNKIDGKTTNTGGATATSLRAMRHLPKVGDVQYVRGYTYRGRYNTTHVGVLVVGTKGSIRFGGFSWGYRGEGSRGLQTLFDSLGIAQDAETIAYWPVSSDVGEHWRVSPPTKKKK